MLRRPGRPQSPPMPIRSPISIEGEGLRAAADTASILSGAEDSAAEDSAAEDSAAQDNLPAIYPPRRLRFFGLRRPARCAPAHSLTRPITLSS
jgi:hypothetical protein